MATWTRRRLGSALHRLALVLASSCPLTALPPGVESGLVAQETPAATPQALPDSVDRDYRDELPESAPLEPSAALASLSVPAGLRVELVAAEPQVMDPVSLAFDEHGRLFVVEMRDYSEQDQEQLGRVRLLTDADHDGYYERSQVFAEGLSWPTSVTVVQGGVLVAAAPDIVYLGDRDGDGRADERQVVWTGFGRNNVQALLNNLQWGIDNWIHGATSKNAATVMSPLQPGEETRLDGRDFAWQPRTGQLQIETGGGQHGMTFDMWGHKFCCSNSDHLRQVIGNEQELARNPLLAVPDTSLSIAADGPAAEVFRASPVEPWRVVRTRLRVQGIVPGLVEGGGRAAGYFTSATGLVVYTGHRLPPEYHGRVFVGDVGSNLVHQKQLRWDGVQAVGERVDHETEFLRSTDTWFRPVQMANGPDGALYVLDMYRQVIEHPWSLPPIIKQHLDLTRGRDRGRIYRVVADTPRDAAEQPRERWPGEMSPREWVGLLSHPNGWHRLTAARLLCEASEGSEAESLKNLVGSFSSDDAQVAGRIHALHVLNFFDQLDDATLLVALHDRHPQVRRHGVLLARARWQNLAQDAPLRKRLLAMVADDDAEVRYVLASSLSGSDHSTVVSSLLELARQDGGRRWHDLALLSAMHPHQNYYLRELLSDSEGPSWSDGAARHRLVVELAREVQQQTADPQRWAEFLDELGGESPEQLRRLLSAQMTSYQYSPAWIASCLSTQQGRPLDLALQEIWQSSVAVAQAADERLEGRLQAIRRMSCYPWEQVEPVFAELFSSRQMIEVQLEVLEACITWGDAHPGIPTWIGTRLNPLTPAVRSRAVERLLTRPAWTTAWLAAMDETVRASLGQDLQLVQQLRSSEQPALRELADQLAPPLQSDRQSLASHYIDELNRLAEEPAVAAAGTWERGQALFSKHCVNCHGPKPVGPPVEVLKSRGREQLVLALLDPNREVDPRYQVHVVELADGRVQTGVLVSENANSIQLGEASGDTTTVLRANIEQLKSTARSLMPEGFERELSPSDVLAISEYLRGTATQR